VSLPQVVLFHLVLIFLHRLGEASLLEAVPSSFVCEISTILLLCSWVSLQRIIVVIIIYLLVWELIIFPAVLIVLIILQVLLLLPLFLLLLVSRSISFIVFNSEVFIEVVEASAMMWATPSSSVVIIMLWLSLLLAHVGQLRILRLLLLLRILKRLRLVVELVVRLLL